MRKGNKEIVRKNEKKNTMKNYVSSREIK